MQGPTARLDLIVIQAMWLSWSHSLLEASAVEAALRVSAFLARKADIHRIAERAKRDVIRGLMAPLLEELEQESSQGEGRAEA